MGDYTRTERTARMNERRKAEGWRRFNIWAPPTAPVERLRRQFPGPQGGLNWDAIMEAALAHAEQRQGEQPETESGN
jgi:hypothetical protein